MLSRPVKFAGNLIGSMSILVFAVGYSLAQCAADSPAAIREQVDGVFNRSLAAMETKVQPGNVTTSTWVPPSQSEKSVIDCLGVAAIPFIAAHLNSKASFGQILAIRMLGWVGTSEIVPPLAEVLNSSASQTAKTNALEALYNAPQADAMQVLSRVSRLDPNPYVRNKASEVLRRYSTANAPQPQSQ
jgi:hypothetical protein